MRMKSLITFAAAALLFLSSASVVQAQNKYESAKGSYAYTGLTIAKTNYNNNNLDALIGIAFGGGMRFNEWIAGDVDFYWAGRDQGNNVKQRGFGITFNAKAYPLGYFSPETLDFIQPYVVMGMGGGNSKFQIPGPNAKEGTFIFRFGAGAEWLFMDNLGAYMDLSLHATPGLKTRGSGGATGVVQFGITSHF